MKKGIFMLSALTAIAFTSCNTIKSTSTTTSTKNERVIDTELSKQLEGTWKLSFFDASLSGLDGKSLHDLFPGKTPELTFDITKHFANGNNGCNNIFGPYYLSNNNGISFGDKWGATMMACNGVSDFAFSNALSKISKYDIKGDNLNLMIADKLVMTLTKENIAATTDLNNTNWVLDFIQPLDRSMKSLSMRFPQQLPTIEIIGKTFTGNSGCNNLSGSFLKTGNDVKFDKIAMTRMFCQDVEENLFVNNLNDVSKVKLENGQLILSNADDMVLLKFKKK